MGAEVAVIGEARGGQDAVLGGSGGALGWGGAWDCVKAVISVCARARLAAIDWQCGGDS